MTILRKARDWSTDHKKYSRDYFQRNKVKLTQDHIKWQKDNPEKARQNARNWRKKYPEKYILGKARNKAKERGLEFNLELDDIVIPDECPYFDEPLEFLGKVHDFAPSLDRINNNKGYIKGNVEVISYLANRMKNDASPDLLRRFAKSILSRKI